MTSRYCSPACSAKANRATRPPAPQANTARPAWRERPCSKCGALYEPISRERYCFDCREADTGKAIPDLACENCAHARPEPQSDTGWSCWLEVFNKDCLPYHPAPKHWVKRGGA